MALSFLLVGVAGVIVPMPTSGYRDTNLGPGLNSVYWCLDQLPRRTAGRRCPSAQNGASTCAA